MNVQHPSAKKHFGFPVSLKRKILVVFAKSFSPGCMAMAVLISMGTQAIEGAAA
jgi:hypothetical protein